jgi:hypothetical protein
MCLVLEIWEKVCAKWAKEPPFYGSEMKSAVKVRRAVERYSERERARAVVRGLLSSRIIVLPNDCLVFSNNLNFTHDELETFIFNICTN